MTTVRASLIPPGPADPYSPKQDLLSWMQRNFERYGDVYKASVYGSNVYVINAPQYVEHVLLRNWENYPRGGAAIKRIALSLGSDDPRLAEAVAGVNLLSRWHFIMQPQLHGGHVAETSDTPVRVM